MSVALLERAALALDLLVPEVVFVGGATLGLWISDEAAAPIRTTLDVDAVVELSSRTALSEFDARLRERGFREDRDSGVICRWVHGQEPDPLTLDVMPTDASLLGFSNEWQRAAVEHSVERTLPSGLSIRAAAPPYLIAMKLEAFDGRGRGDYLMSHDLEDVVALIDGRDAVVDEIAAADQAVRSHLAKRIGTLLETAAFQDALPGHLRPDVASQARRDLVVLPRLRAIASG